TDRLAVVHALQHREQARVLLHQPGDRIEVFAALVARERRPRRERRARRLHCFVDISGATVSDVSERLAGRRIVRREGLASLGPFAVDEVAEGVALARKPRQRRLRTLGRWTVVEALEDFSNLV